MCFIFNKNKAWVCPFILLLLIGCKNSFSMVENFTTRNGLSQNSVQCIAQDRRGYLWFGTQDGLNMYDGYGFKVFRSNPNDSLALKSASITCIYEDSDNQLWIGTLNGLNKFVPVKQSFKLYKFYDISKIAELPPGYFPLAAKKYLLLATGVGLYLFDRNGEKATRIPLSQHASAGGTIQVYDYLWQEGSRPVLWVATKKNGLLRLVFEGFKIVDRQTFLLNENKAPSIRTLASKHDTLWIGTSQGLFYLPLKTSVLAPLKWDVKNNFLPPTAFVKKLYFDHQGRLWIGVMRYGLFVRNGRILKKINNNSILSIYQDCFNILWVGTSGSGLLKYPFEKLKFNVYRPFSKSIINTNLNHIWAIWQDRSGLYWLGTNHGIRFFSPLKKRLEIPPKYQKAAKQIGDVQVRMFREDKMGNIWIATLESGLFQIKPDGAIHNFSVHSEAGLRLPFKSVYSLCIDHRQDVWIGLNEGGLSKAVVHNGEVRSILNFKNLNVGPEKKALWVIDIAETVINGISQIWLATWDYGLIKLNPQNGKITVFNTNNAPHLLSNYILSLHVSSFDSRPVLWLGTYGGGLTKFDLTDFSFTTYTEKDGLANMVVYAILEDDNHHIWLSTNKGLSRFNPATQQFTNYAVCDGLQSEEFNLNAAFKDADGRLFFGGVNGLNYFMPGEVINAIPPKIDICKVSVFGKSKKEVLYAPFIQPLKFDHSFNSFEIEFVALHYLSPQKHKYVYQMEGWGNNWIDAGKNRKVTFLNLNPGKYVFKVKACNGDGVWAKRAASIQIIVAPPFWKTGWAIIFYIFGIGLLLFYLHRRRLAQEIKIARVKEQERLQTRQEIDEDLHNEIGGNVYKIIQACKHILRSDKPEYLELLIAIKKILDWAVNLEYGIKELFWEVKAKSCTLEDLIITLKLNADLIFEEDRYDLQLLNEIQDSLQRPIPLKLRQTITSIFKEGMTNILKHSTDCKNIILSLRNTEDDLLEIILTDDGAGFDVTGNFSGKGLKSMINKAKKVNGQLTITSCRNYGTTLIFRVKLP